MPLLEETATKMRGIDGVTDLLVEPQVVERELLLLPLGFSDTQSIRFLLLPKLCNEPFEFIQNLAL